MRVVATFVALAALAAVIVGDAAASHPAKEALSRSAGSPTWSPDGKQIAFAYRSTSKTSPRYRIVRTSSKPGGTIHSVLATSSYCCGQLQWVSADRFLVNPGHGLESVRVHGGKTKRLAFPSCGADRPRRSCITVGFIPSPNHEYAAAAITSDLSDPDVPFGIGLVKFRPAQDPVVLTTPLATEESFGFFDTALAFSPDGTQLVFTRTPWDGLPAGPAALMAIGLDGGGAVPLAQSEIPGAARVPNDVTAVQWSPDSRWVAYIENRNLEVVPTTGAGTPRVLAMCGGDSAFAFSWSPTSKLIADDCAAASRSRFMTISPDGTRPTSLLQGHNLVYEQTSYGSGVYSAGGAQWSPDGSRLLFTAHAPHSKLGHIWTIRANGTHLTRRG